MKCPALKEEKQKSDDVYSVKDNILKLAVVVKPQAKRNAVLGIINGRLKIAIAATPVDGKANKELISFLAKTLEIRKQDVEIINGSNNSIKLLHIPADIQSKLDKILL